MEFPILTSILLAPILGIIIILLLPETKEKEIKVTAAIVTFILLFLSTIAFVTYNKAIGGLQFQETYSWIPAFGINYSVGADGLSIPLILLTAIVIFAGIFSSWKLEKRIKEFFIFLLLLVAGVFGVFISRDLFFFYIFFEIAVIPMYILIGVWGSTRKNYAAMKLTLYLLVGSAFILIGIIATFVYASNLGIRSFDIQTLSTIQYSSSFQKFAFFLMLIGFGILVPMWPFHTWSPDGHVAAPTAVSMLHAGVLMKLGGYGIIRAGVFLFPEGAKYWVPLIAVLSIANIVYGAMVAMAQKDLKFVIGYSSVSHMGYVLLGIASLNFEGIDGAVAQMFAHGIMTALFFTLIGNIYNQAHTREIACFGGLVHQMPRVAVGFIIAGFASLGLPGLNNFVAEFLIFLGSHDEPRKLFSIIPFKAISIIAILGIVITAAYILKVIQNTFFGPRKEEWDHLEDARGVEMIPIVMLAGVLIFFGLIPSPLIDLIHSGAMSLMGKISDIGMIMGGF
ncbi:NADH-quinone oxidoreductase subunit M [Clostridium sp. Maddingley MBC34-26]|uniref:complex I subunit 4 family protein n=2 Tax=unclassified Clostridium TaxID=2614128 RepID=UPI0002983688|nr:NADH-quinone oxidoreductase subunit M [Clostridium sp. Maddingley MBC34-26]EKQ55821.1 MAG: proton-translocating NADH-quinone oxidoreductase, chain M [Clostridium sp. Maddingley MBC34-26]